MKKSEVISVVFLVLAISFLLLGIIIASVKNYYSISAFYLVGFFVVLFIGVKFASDAKKEEEENCSLAQQLDESQECEKDTDCIKYPSNKSDTDFFGKYFGYIVGAIVIILMIVLKSYFLVVYIGGIAVALGLLFFSELFRNFSAKDTENKVFAIITLVITVFVLTMAGIEFIKGKPTKVINGLTVDCDCKFCSDIKSCDEAYFLLNQCGCSSLDRDKDGVPCDNLCR